MSVEPRTVAVRQDETVSIRCRVTGGAQPVQLEWKRANNQPLAGECVTPLSSDTTPSCCLSSSHNTLKRFLFPQRFTSSHILLLITEPHIVLFIHLDLHLTSFAPVLTLYLAVPSPASLSKLIRAVTIEIMVFTSPL